MLQASEILEKIFSDGSVFRASESFVCKWLHEEMAWSRRKGTQAAHKLPDNWEDQCEKSFFRKAYVIKEEDIPASLIVNSDQTQVVYAPGDKMTWAPTGTKQVSIYGADEKCAFTVLVSVASNGMALPMQAIYSGKTKCSCPSHMAPHHDDLLAAGFLLEESGTKTYWSNHETMQSFVNNILAPYFDHEKVKLGLPSSQKSLWCIDVWSVHHLKKFTTWMCTSHPTIVLDFVPGGCTGVFQPCDIGIQRPFKLSIKRSYHEDIVLELLQQFEAKQSVIKIDDRLASVRDWTPGWIWNAHQTVNNPELVKKAFEHCVVKQWNLSYGCLTGIAACARLRELKETEPEFWVELTIKGCDEIIPPESVPQPEDVIRDDDDDDDLAACDDSDVSIQVLMGHMVDSRLSRGFSLANTGMIVAECAAEDFNNELTDVVVEEVLGHGKRIRRPNQLYSAKTFWHHNNNNEVDDY